MLSLFQSQYILFILLNLLRDDAAHAGHKLVNGMMYRWGPKIEKENSRLRFFTYKCSEYLIFLWPLFILPDFGDGNLTLVLSMWATPLNPDPYILSARAKGSPW